MQTDQRATPTEPHVPESRGVCVLIVDDSLDATEMLSLVLDHKGFANERAHTGREALSLYESLNPDVVLLDLGLPDMDGFAVATRMRELNPRPLLIALTGFGDDQTLEAVRRCGFSRHLLKPVSWDALDAVLAQAADKKA